MKLLFYCSLSLFFLNTSLSFAQSRTKRLSVAIFTGMDLGWWIYNKGSINQNIINELGQDRTKHSIMLNGGLDILYSFKQWKLGIGIADLLLLENEMIGFKDSQTLFDEYLIADKAVNFLKFNLCLAYDLVQNDKFALSPHIRYGIFRINTLHPERDNFGLKTYWEVGLNNQIKFKKFDFLFRPIWNQLYIKPKQPKSLGENHRIYALGLQFALKFYLF